MNNTRLIEPHLPLEIFEMMHDLSLFLIVDDKHDLGHFAYSKRDDHYYHFKKSPDHPSPIHHWQIGVIGLFVSQVGALVSKALDIKSSLSQQQQPISINHIQKKKPALPEPESNYSKIIKALDNI